MSNGKLGLNDRFLCSESSLIKISGFRMIIYLQLHVMLLSGISEMCCARPDYQSPVWGHQNTGIQDLDVML